MPLISQQSQSFEPTGYAEWFRRRAARAPERPALSFGGQTWAYGEMQAEIERLSSVLFGLGIGRGDRVAYLGLNNPMTLFAGFAAARIGAILVPLNFRLAPAELVAIMADAVVCGVIADQQYAPVLETVRELLECDLFLTFGADLAGWRRLESLQAAVQAIVPQVDVDPDDIVTLMYTSGTTGLPKGVMISHRNIWVNNMNWVLTSDFTSGDVTVVCAPLFHVGGLCVVLLVTLFTGGHLVLQEGFDPALYLKEMEQYRATVSFAVPAMLLFSSQHADFGTADLSAMRLIVAGGAPVPEPLLKTYADRAIPISQCYGMTEATAGLTFLETERGQSKLGSCGRAGPLNEVKLIDPAGKRITESGVKGELCARGGNITPGYWNRPDATVAALDAEGWYRTGDGAYFDDEGFYYICDRIKDMIISGGENIYPAEIEGLLYEHPNIAEVAVIGAPDEKWGEKVVVVAVLKPGSALDLPTVVAFLEAKLARYKLPKVLELVDALPRNSNGKVVKTDLRERFGKA